MTEETCANCGYYETMHTKGHRELLKEMEARVPCKKFKPQNQSPQNETSGRKMEGTPIYKSPEGTQNHAEKSLSDKSFPIKAKEPNLVYAEGDVKEAVKRLKQNKHCPFELLEEIDKIMGDNLI